MIESYLKRYVEGVPTVSCTVLLGKRKGNTARDMTSMSVARVNGKDEAHSQQ